MAQNTPPSATGLDALTAQLERLDFTKLGANDPTPGDMLYMLSNAEIKKAQTDDSMSQLQDQIQKWRSQAETARMPEERQWLKNLDMYEGRQFTTYDAETRSTVTSVTPAGEIRIPINVCQPIIRTEIAKTTSSHPVASVQPASNDDEDIFAARAAEAAWEWFFATEKIQQNVLNQSNFWRAITGNGFGKVFYDQHSVDDAATSMAMRQYKQQLADTPDMGAFGALLKPDKPKPIYGKVTAENVSPFFLFFGNLLEPNIQRQPYILQVSLIPKETAKLIYKDVMPKDWEPSTVDGADVVDLTRLGVKGGNAGNVDMVRVTEAWIRPNVTQHLPEGGLVIMLDNRIVAMSKDGLPYDHFRMPYQHIYTVETGRFYRTSVLVPIIPIQNELNRIYGQLIKYKNLASAPQFFYRQGSVDPTRIRPRAGTWIPIQLGMEYPQAVPLPQMPQYVTDLIDALKQVIDDISGQHQVSRAISPGADTAASAISMLREADDDYLSNTLDSIEAFVEEMAQQVLSLMVQCWDEPRLVRVAGESETMSVHQLTGADIASATDIRTTVGSGLPQSRSARQALITEWMDKGYIPPAVGLKAIEAGALGKLFKLLQIDEDQADRENVKMAATTEQEYTAWQNGQLETANPPALDFGTGPLGAPAVDPTQAPDPTTAAPDAALPPVGTDPAAEQIDPAAGADAAAAALPPAIDPVQAPIFFPINDFDNHAIHIEVVERKMKSQEYSGYPDWKKQIFLDHRAAHVAAVAGQMQQGAIQQSAMASANSTAQMAQGGYAGGQTTPELPAPAQ